MEQIKSFDTLMEDPRLLAAVVSPMMPQDGAGGVTSAHFNIYRSLKLHGCKARFLTFGDQSTFSGNSDVMRSGASVHLKSILAFATHCYLKLLGSAKPAYQLADIILSLPGSFCIRRHLAKLRPDVVIIPDHGAPGLLLSNKQSPIILVVHHIASRFISNPLLGDFCRLDAAKATSLEQRVLSRVDAVVCPSEYMRDVFWQTYTFDGEVTVIPNPVDENMIDSVKSHDVCTEIGLSGTIPVVYIPSAGSQLKGSRYVFEIIRRVAGACDGPICFYLSGAIGTSLKAELCHIPENVFLFTPGPVSLQTNISYIKSCSFGISPTLIESFGMSLLEASYCNVPMVTFDTGGTGEVICNGKNGFLIPYLDIEALISAAISLLDMNYCSTLGQSSGVYAKNTFNSLIISQQYLDLCNKLSCHSY